MTQADFHKRPVVTRDGKELKILGCNSVRGFLPIFFLRGSSSVRVLCKMGSDQFGFTKTCCEIRNEIQHSTVCKKNASYILKYFKCACYILEK